MKKYNKFDIDRVKSAADIRDFIPGLSGRGATQYCECPECHKSGRNKGLCVTHKTNMDIAKCFSCGFTINGAIDAVQYYDKVEFIDALQIVASRYNILLETEMEKRQRAIDRSREKVKQSFCLSQLEASGLTVKDVTAKVRLDDKSGKSICRHSSEAVWISISTSIRTMMKCSFTIMTFGESCSICHARGRGQSQTIRQDPVVESIVTSR